MRLALNRVAEEAVWKDGALRAELRELVDLGFDLDLTGFDGIEIDHLLEIDLSQNARADANAFPDLQDKAVSAPGDIWVCDRHRVGCGESGDELFVRKVCGSGSAAMAFIDLLDSAAIGQVLSEESGGHQTALIRSGLEMRITSSINVLKTVYAKDALIYALIHWQRLSEMLDTSKACGLSLRDVCVWAKPEASMGCLYRDQHELICIFQTGVGEDGCKAKLNRHGRKRSNLWTYRGPNLQVGEAIEPARGVIKPAVLVADAIRDATKRGAVVIDTFLGCGTTMIAAEQTARTCIGIERDPLYVDVAIRRWQQHSQSSAVHAERGERFDDVAQRVCEGEINT